MNTDEESWSEFLSKLVAMFQLPSIDGLALLEKGHGPWDSLKNIQIYVVLRELRGDSIDSNLFLSASKILDLKVFFTNIK